MTVTFLVLVIALWNCMGYCPLQMLFCNQNISKVLQLGASNIVSRQRIMSKFMVNYLVKVNFFF